MIVSTILLTPNNFYVDDKGNLPFRPSFDKELLTALSKNQKVSDTAFLMLPPSIKEIVKFAGAEEPTVGIIIPEIDALTDLLIVSRSIQKLDKGKKFRFDNFRLLVEDTQIEIWIRK